MSEPLEFLLFSLDFVEKALRGVMANTMRSWASVLLLGCGARTELPFEDPAADSFDIAATSPAPASDSQPGAGRNRRGFFEDVDLPDCVPGGPPSSATRCAYMADGLCYPDKISACACVCPPTRSSTCSSGLFENEFGAITVRCQ